MKQQPGVFGTVRMSHAVLLCLLFFAFSHKQKRQIRQVTPAALRLLPMSLGHQNTQHRMISIGFN
ncbi:MAG: hypothetical protein ABFR65_10925 [Pseudomonadota bacterium]